MFPVSSSIVSSTHFLCSDSPLPAITNRFWKPSSSQCMAWGLVGGNRVIVGFYVECERHKVSPRLEQEWRKPTSRLQNP
jgi:hypothetical protein